MNIIYFISSMAAENQLELKDYISFGIQIVQTIALIITIWVTICSTRKMNKATYDNTEEMIKDNLIRGFRDQLDSILKISIEYPVLESDKIIKGWIANKNSGNEDYIRYDLYCTMIFNLGERVSEYFKYDDKKINKFINFRDWIKSHKNYWIYPISSDEDKKSFKEEYRKLIENWIK